MKIREVLLLASIGLGLVAGCEHGSPTVSLSPPAAPVPVKAYDAVRDRWTRSERVLKALDTPLEVHATLFAPEFASAYLARRAQMFELPAAERAAAERKLKDALAGTFTFMVSATSHDWSWIDFERPGSVWRIVLQNAAGEQVAPRSIELERRLTPTVTELFPYVVEFSRVYTLRFPQALPDGRPLLRGGAERLTLLFAGPLGQADLVWRLR